jgi:hypothetical protein
MFHISSVDLSLVCSHVVGNEMFHPYEEYMSSISALKTIGVVIVPSKTWKIGTTTNYTKHMCRRCIHVGMIMVIDSRVVPGTHLWMPSSHHHLTCLLSNFEDLMGFCLYLSPSACHAWSQRRKYRSHTRKIHLTLCHRVCHCIGRWEGLRNRQIFSHLVCVEPNTSTFYHHGLMTPCTCYSGCRSAGLIY